MKKLIMVMFFLLSCQKNENPKLEVSQTKIQKTEDQSKQVYTAIKDEVSSAPVSEETIQDEIIEEFKPLNIKEISSPLFAGKKGYYLEIPVSDTKLSLISEFKDFNLSISGGVFWFENTKICFEEMEKCTLGFDYFRTTTENDPNLGTSIFLALRGVANEEYASVITKARGFDFKLRLANDPNVNLYYLDGSGKATAISQFTGFFQLSAVLSSKLQQTAPPIIPKNANELLPYDLLDQKDLYYKLKGKFLLVSNGGDLSKRFKLYTNESLEGDFQRLEVLKPELLKSSNYFVQSIYARGGDSSSKEFIRVGRISPDLKWLEVISEDKKYYLDARPCWNKECKVIYLDKSGYEIEKEKLVEIQKNKSYPFLNYLREKLLPCIEKNDVDCVRKYFLRDEAKYVQDEEACWDSSVTIPEYSFNKEDFAILKGCLDYDALLPNLSAGFYKGKYCVFAPSHTQSNPSIRLLTITADQKNFLQDYQYYSLSPQVRIPLENYSDNFYYTVPVKKDNNYDYPNKIPTIVLNIPSVQRELLNSLENLSKFPEIELSKETIHNLALNKFHFERFLTEKQKHSPEVIKTLDFYKPVYELLVHNYAEDSEIVHPEFFSLPGYIEKVAKSCSKGNIYDLSIIEKQSQRDLYLKTFIETLKSTSDISPEKSCYPLWLRTNIEVFKIIQKNPNWFLLYLNRELDSVKFMFSGPDKKMKIVSREYKFQKDYTLSEKEIELMETSEFQKQLFSQAPFYISRVDSRVNLNEELMKIHLANVYDPARFFSNDQKKQASVKNFLKMFPNKTSKHLEDYKIFIKSKYSYEELFLAMPDELLGDVEFHFSYLRKPTATHYFYLRDLVKIKGPKKEIFEMILKICEKGKSINYRHWIEELKGEGFEVPENVLKQAVEKCKNSA